MDIYVFPNFNLLYQMWLCEYSNNGIRIQERILRITIHIRGHIYIVVPREINSDENDWKQVALRIVGFKVERTFSALR